MAAEKCEFSNLATEEAETDTKLQITDLSSSGADMVYTQALFAIIGALSLEQGGMVANRVVRERILQVIGLKSGLAGDIQPEQLGSSSELQ